MYGGGGFAWLQQVQLEELEDLRRLVAEASEWNKSATGVVNQIQEAGMALVVAAIPVRCLIIDVPCAVAVLLAGHISHTLQFPSAAVDEAHPT